MNRIGMNDAFATVRAMKRTQEKNEEAACEEVNCTTSVNGK